MSDKTNHAYVEPWQGCALAWSEGPRMQDARVCGKPREAHPGQGWQPIDTAPRDGTEIIAASIYTVKGKPRVWNVYLTCADAAGWVTTRGGKAAPTHWIPIPEPPK